MRLESATVIAVNSWNKTVSIRFKGVVYHNVPMRKPRSGSVNVIVCDNTVVVIE
jgi:hypothetical protein